MAAAWGVDPGAASCFAQPLSERRPPRGEKPSTRIDPPTLLATRRAPQRAPPRRSPGRAAPRGSPCRRRHAAGPGRAARRRSPAAAAIGQRLKTYASERDGRHDAERRARRDAPMLVAQVDDLGRVPLVAEDQDREEDEGEQHRDRPRRARREAGSHRRQPPRQRSGRPPRRGSRSTLVLPTAPA